MKCLLVKAPFAKWIVQAVKPVEYRRQNTCVRGRIGIMQSGAIGNNPEVRAVLGDVELFNCVYNNELGLYMWMLRFPRSYFWPVFVPVRHGPQVWIDENFDVPTPHCINLNTKEHNDELAKCKKAEQEAIRYLRNKGPVKMWRHGHA